jgi:hypothetical protein
LQQRAEALQQALVTLGGDTADLAEQSRRRQRSKKPQADE